MIEFPTDIRDASETYAGAVLVFRRAARWQTQPVGGMTKRLVASRGV
jgi:hypothetical protein